MQSNNSADGHRSLIPPNNYLWKSPYGVAYPGWHHQLILHLAAHKQSVWSNPTFEGVKARLVKYPDYAVDDSTLKAILGEYLQLNLQTRWAYRDMEFNVPVIRKRPSPSTNADMEVDWESILDPALFDHSDQSSTPVRDIWSSPQPSSASTIGTRYSDISTKPIARNVGELESPVNALPSMFDQGLRQSKWHPNSPITPNKIVSIPTPSRPHPDRFRREQYELDSPTPRSTNLHQPIDRDIGRILFFSKGIHDSRQRSTMADPNEADKMRLPNPNKYIQTSRKHYTIPESEAAAFVHWFEPEVDALPDKIEGYYWYCDECYIGDVTGFNGGNIRGKFNHRRSAQKHQETVHANSWKPVLPELDRGVTVKGVEEDVENYGPGASETTRRRLFGEDGNDGVGARKSRRGVKGGEQSDVGRPVIAGRRKGAEVLLDFADIKQVKGARQKK